MTNNILGKNRLIVRAIFLFCFLGLAQAGFGQKKFTDGLSLEIRLNNAFGVESTSFGSLYWYWLNREQEEKNSLNFFPEIRLWKETNNHFSIGLGLRNLNRTTYVECWCENCFKRLKIFKDLKINFIEIPVALAVNKEISRASKIGLSFELYAMIYNSIKEKIDEELVLSHVSQPLNFGISFGAFYSIKISPKWSLRASLDYRRDAYINKRRIADSTKKISKFQEFITGISLEYQL